MATPLKLGVDNGNYNTKSSDGMVYASGFAQSSKGFITVDMQLEYGGSFYAMGGQRMKLQQDKTKSQDTFLLTLPAIANHMKGNGMTSADILLGVRLPIDIYGAQREAFRRYFLRDEIIFKYEDIPYRCRIVDCKVFPQGHAALCRHYQNLKQHGSLLLVDIGGYTVDVMALHDFKPDKQSCASIRKGTIILYNAIRNQLQQQNILLNDAQITDAIKGRVEHRQKELIHSVIQCEIRQYLKELLNTLREYGHDLQLPVVFAGGGAELLEAYLRQEDVHLVGLLNSFANTEGYRVLLG